MANCPLNRSNPPCDMEMDLLILQEAERESMEVFFNMRQELQFYLKRTLQLEKLLGENGIPLPEDEA